MPMRANPQRRRRAHAPNPHHALTLIDFTQGGNVCFDGVIAKVHPDAGDGHTYDITYDDGDQEARVHRDHIFVVCVAGGDYDNDVAKDDPWPGEAEAEDEGEAEGQGEHEGEDEGDGQDEDEDFDGGGGTDEVGDQSGSPAATRHIDAVKEEEEKTDRRAPAEPNSTAASSKSKQYGKASQRIAPSNGGSSSSPPLGGGEAFGLSRALQADVDKGGGSGGSEKKKKGKEKRNGELKRKESILNWGTQQFIETAGIDASINHLGAALSTDKDLAGLVNEFKQKKTKVGRGPLSPLKTVQPLNTLPPASPPLPPPSPPPRSTSAQHRTTTTTTNTTTATSRPPLHRKSPSLC